MNVKLEFEPVRLKAFVEKLQDQIGVATGQPLRLDMEQHLEALRNYIDTKDKNQLPSEYSLQILTSILPGIYKLKLDDGLFECLGYRSNSAALFNVLEFYFGNYEFDNIKAFLRNNISEYRIEHPAWGVWSSYPNVFFSDNAEQDIVRWIIDKQIEISSITKYIVFREQTKLHAAVIKELLTGEYFKEYIVNLPLKMIVSMLKDDGLGAGLNRAVWNISLPIYLDDAESLKSSQDIDHELFAFAKSQLHPTKGPRWLALSEEAKKAYQQWAIGHLVERFFDDDQDNKRIQFWKQHITRIEEIKEIEYRGQIASVCLSIGKYDFLEFKDIGAIYVYPKGSVRIPRRVGNLDRELKFRDLVIKAGHGTEYGEGWIPHRGRIWTARAERMIKEAFRT